MPHPPDSTRSSSSAQLGFTPPPRGGHKYCFANDALDTRRHLGLSTPAWRCDVHEAVADPAVVRQNQIELASDVFPTGRVQRACFDEVVTKSGIPEAGLGDGDDDDLIRAYLQSRFARIQDRMLRELSGFPSARQRIIGVFEILGRSFAEPAFERDVEELTLATEASLPEAPVEGMRTNYHNWIRNLFCDLAHAAQVTRPEELAEQLVMIYRGTCVTACMDRRPDIAATASSLARTVVAAATDPSAN